MQDTQYVIVPWLCLETQCLAIILVDYTSSQLGIVVIPTYHICAELCDGVGLMFWQRHDSSVCVTLLGDEISLQCYNGCISYTKLLQ